LGAGYVGGDLGSCGSEPSLWWWWCYDGDDMRAGWRRRDA